VRGPLWEIAAEEQREFASTTKKSESESESEKWKE